MQSLIFHSYDVRGIVDEQLNGDTFFKIGNATANYLKAKKIAVGYDMRTTSKEYADQLIKGIMDFGADVVDIGLIATEQLYFEIGRDLSYDGGVIITASHNPKEYNGAKIMGKYGRAIGLGEGLEEIQKLFEQEIIIKNEKIGNKVSKSVYSEFQKHILNESNLSLSKPLNIAVDAGNGIGGVLFDQVFGALNLNVKKMYFTPDGTFPNHEANPKKIENMSDLINEVTINKYDIGFALDGDSDRVGVVDSKGRVLENIYTAVIIAKELIGNGTNRKIIHEPRITMAITDSAKKYNWELAETIAGRSFIKKSITDTDAEFAFENSGHFLYKKMYHSDSSAMTIALILRAIDNGFNVTEFHSEMLQKFPIAGEVNFKVDSPTKIFEIIENRFPDAKTSKVDGLSMNFDSWRMNIRKSNTEPLIRLNIEANNEENLIKYYNLVNSIISVENGGEQKNKPAHPILLK